MQANGFTLQTARDHEAHLLKLAAAVKVLPPRPLTRPRRLVSMLRRLLPHAVRGALDGGAQAASLVVHTEPSDGLEPLTPSLPCRGGRNWWQLSAADRK